MKQKKLWPLWDNDMQGKVCFLNETFAFFQDNQVSCRRKCILIGLSLFFSLAWTFLTFKFSQFISAGITLWSFIALSTVVLFLFIYQEIISIQKIRNKFSWVFYLYFTLITSPFFILFITTLLEPKNPFLNITFFKNLVWINTHSDINIFPFCLSVGISLIAFLLHYFTQPKNYTDQLRRFSSSAVGKKDDKLGFNNYAEKLSVNVGALTKPVNVVSVCGEFGEGKSSYVRMIVENLDQEKTLYTYVSLTETNEAKGFSKLFSERWISTLKERYSIFDGAAALKVMQLIFKEFESKIVEFSAWIFSLLLEPFQTAHSTAKCNTEVNC